MNRNGFGEVIDRLLAKYSLNSKEFAEKCGIGESAASSVRKGDKGSDNRVQAIIKKLPKTEIDRAELQRELLIDYIYKLDALSPLLSVTAHNDFAQTLEEKIQRSPLTETAKESFMLLVQGAEKGDELSKAMELIAAQLKNWKIVSDPESAGNELPMVAEKDDDYEPEQ